MKLFRPNVLAVLTDDQKGQVLVFRRVDIVLGGNRWQFPQGGLDPGEKPEQGLLRELKEDIGTDNVEILMQAPDRIQYVFPPDIQAELSKGDPEKARYQGQEQYWFLARLLNGPEEIHFNHQPQEFDAFQWVSPDRAVKLAVHFKKEAYRKGLNALGLLIR